MADGASSRRARRTRSAPAREPFVHQFVNGEPDGPVPFHYPAPDYAADLELARGLIGIASLRSRLERLGSTVTSQVWRLGYASRFLVYLVLHSGTALRRFRLTIARDLLRRRAVADHHPGVGAVRRHGARAAGLRDAAALRRLGVARRAGGAVAGARARPGGGGAAVRQPRRLGDHRRDRPDEGDRADLGDGDDGGRPDRARGRAALLGRGDLDAAARGAVLARWASSAATWSACS